MMFNAQENSSRAILSANSRGLLLKESILCLDSGKDNHLSFLSSVPEKRDPALKKLITTEETLHIIGGKKAHANSLICQYNRPFSLGNLKMELFPSGHCLGGALLHLEYQKGSLLYAPRLLVDKVSHLRKLQLKEADTLILRADLPILKKPHPSRAREKERLLNKMELLAKERIYPILFCKNLAIAQELTLLLSKENYEVLVHPSIYRLNKIHEHFGTVFGKYQALRSLKKIKDKVIILPSSLVDRLGHYQSLNRPIFLIKDHKESFSLSFLKKDNETFFIPQYSFGFDLENVIKSVKPHALYFFGDYASEYCKIFAPLAKIVEPIFQGERVLF